MEGKSLDLHYGLAMAKRTRFPSAGALVSWCAEKMDQIEQLLKATDRIFEVALPDALGPPGVPGDPEKLVYVAERLGEIYLTLIRWSADFLNLLVEEEQRSLVELMGRFVDNMIKEIETFSDDLEPAIARVLATRTPGRIDLVLTTPDVGPLNEEVRKILGRSGL